MISTKLTPQVFHFKLNFRISKKTMNIQISFRIVAYITLISRPVDIEKTFNNSPFTQ